MRTLSAVLREKPDYRAALIRSRNTGCRCDAAIWMKNRLSGEWYEWDACTDDPGHDSPHAIRDEAGCMSFHPWRDGDSGVDEMEHYGTVIRTEWRSEPSPWTPAELAAWAAIGAPEPPSVVTGHKLVTETP